MSTENSGPPQPLELDIFSLPFRLRAPVDEHARLERAAKHVDMVMRELVAGQPSADTTRLAIQAAFLVATEYFRNMDEAFAGGSEQANPVGRRMDDVLLALDQALSGIKTVLPAGEEIVDRPEPVWEAEAVLGAESETMTEPVVDSVPEPVASPPEPELPAPAPEPQSSHVSDEASSAPRKRSHFS